MAITIITAIVHTINVAITTSTRTSIATITIARPIAAATPNLVITTPSATTSSYFHHGHDNHHRHGHHYPHNPSPHHHHYNHKSVPASHHIHDQYHNSPSPLQPLPYLLIAIITATPPSPSPSSHQRSHFWFGGYRAVWASRLCLPWAQRCRSLSFAPSCGACRNRSVAIAGPSTA